MGSLTALESSMRALQDPLSESELAILVRVLPVPLALLKRDGAVIASNGRFEELWGRKALHPADVPALSSVSCHGSAPVELRLTGAMGERLCLSAIGLGSYAVLLFFDAIAQDESYRRVAELQRRIAQLQRLVATDTLTGAWNRSHLDRIMSMELSRSARHKQPLSVLLLDIDHFKDINDTHGHSAGDEVLRKLVNQVQAQIRLSDMLFRWGGEEFLVLVPSTPCAHACNLAEKIRCAVERSTLPSVGRVTISIGVAQCMPGESAQSLFERADKALYAAKQGGRNRTVADRDRFDEWKTGMLRLHWTDELACGEPAVDLQHQQLFELANELIDASLRETFSQSDLKLMLIRLFDQVRQHFSEEEHILQRVDYSQFEEHRAAHAALLKKASQILVLADNGALTFAALIDFLVHDVIAGHMMTSDRQYFAQVGAAQPASETGV